MEQHFIHSSLREKIVEHLFIGELLKYSWIHGYFGFEVSKPEVDNSGYDIVLEANGVIRHVQLKASYVGARTSRQNIHLDLAKKPSGCVVWIYMDKESLDLGPFLFFGGSPGEPLPEISSFSVARHTKGDASGVKKERPNIRKVPKRAFGEYSTIGEIFAALFGGIASDLNRSRSG